MGSQSTRGPLLKNRNAGDGVAVQSSSSAVFPPLKGKKKLPQTAAGDALVQGATSCVTTNHTQLLSGNISQSRHMVMSWRRGEGGGRERCSGSGMGAIRLEKKMEGEEDGQEGTTERES